MCYNNFLVLRQAEGDGFCGMLGAVAFGLPLNEEEAR